MRFGGRPSWDLVGSGQGVVVEAEVAEAEPLERGQDPGGVGRGRADEEVDVAGEAGKAVERDGVAADDQELNARRA